MLAILNRGTKRAILTRVKYFTTLGENPQNLTTIFCCPSNSKSTTFKVLQLNFSVALFAGTFQPIKKKTFAAEEFGPPVIFPF
jgi:hypothetical protein